MTWGFVLTLMVVLPLSKLQILKQPTEPQSNDGMTDTVTFFYIQYISLNVLGLDSVYTRERLKSNGVDPTMACHCKPFGRHRKPSATSTRPRLPSVFETAPKRVSTATLETPRVLSVTNTDQRTRMSSTLRAPPKYSRDATDGAGPVTQLFPPGVITCAFFTRSTGVS